MNTHETKSLLDRLGAGLTRRLSKPAPLFFLELFVAVSLTVNFFYLVRTQCLPKPNGVELPSLTFSYFSGKVALNPNDILPSWRTRLMGPIISSWLLDRQITEPVNFNSKKYHSFLELTQAKEFQDIFGLYHSVWLFLSFLTLILFRKDALLLILGVFVGLMYNLAAPSGMYYYPWDLPTLFFFTLACLLFDRGRIWSLLPVVIVGSLFKETTLCCALLILLGNHWTWPKRIVGFLAVMIAVFAMNRLLLAHYGIGSSLLAMNNARNPSLFQNTLLFKNVRFLFGFDLYHVIFANAGALLLMMLIPWRNRRDVVFKIVILVFALGQFFYGVIYEVRIWYELLPLGWILISEDVSRRENVENPGTERTALLWRRSYWLTLGALLFVALVLLVVARRDLTPAEKENKTSEQILQETRAAAEKGKPDAQFNLARDYERKRDYESAIEWYRRAAEQGFLDAQYCLGVVLFDIRHDDTAAAEWFRKAADQGYPPAQYSLGVIFWKNQNYNEAVKLFQAAAHQGDMYAQWMLGTVYQTRNGDIVEAYKWLKLSQLQGFNVARKDWETCAASMTADQIAAGEARVKEFQQSRK